MKEKCGICGGKVAKFVQVQVSDGIVCPLCGRICSKSMLASLEKIKLAWGENHKRFNEFKQSMVISDFGSGYIFVDAEHQFCYISNTKKSEPEPVVFTFSEIEEFSVERVGEKTVVKKKGGFSRAAVGGVLFGGVGAIVGASTAKEETQTIGGISILYITIALHGLKTTVSMSNPPLRTTEFLDNAMEAITTS